jgi:Kef-type K+ transport system membrane component KefB
MRVLLILILAGLMHAARSFAPDTAVGGGAAGTALACGYLLLSAFFMGSIFKSLGLPRLTGYLTTGILVGPQVLGLVSHPMVANLQIFNGLATALIALTAGVELDFRAIRPLIRSINLLSLIAVCGTIGLITGAVFLMHRKLPFMHSMTPVQVAAFSLVLGVVVISDLLVIILFALVSSVAKTVMGSRADAWHTAGALAWELLGSISVGLLVGVVIAVYLRYVKGSASLFVIAAAFLVAEVGQRIELDPLLVALAAGVLIRNVTRQGKRLQDEIEVSSLPVYVVFFAVAGATVHIKELFAVWIAAVALVLTRAAGFSSLGWVATTLADAEENVRKYVGFGLMPQAGLALALALLFVKTFPKYGAEASALVFGTVAINELIAPVLYRFALIKSGEAGKSERSQPGKIPAAQPTH